MLPANPIQAAAIAQAGAGYTLYKYSLNDKVECQTLYRHAEWPTTKIAKYFNRPTPSIQTILKQNLPIIHAPTAPRGRPALKFTEEQINYMIAHATALQENKRKTLVQIAQECGYRGNEKTLRKAFAAFGYGRQIARKKYALTAVYRAERLAFALAHAH